MIFDTLLEIALIGLCIYGYFIQDKLIKFEQRIFKFIKQKFRFITKLKKDKEKNMVSETTVVRPL